MIAYVLGEYPSLTETFILREIRALLQRGISLCVFSLTKPDREDEALFPDDLPRIEAFYGPGKWDRDLLGRAVKGIFSRKGSRPRVEAAVEDWLPVLRTHPEITHLHGHFANEPTLASKALSEASGLPFSFSGHAWDIYCSDAPIRELISAAAFVTTCTQANLDYLRSVCRPEDRDCIYLLRHGVDLNQFYYLERPKSKPFRCLALGRLVPKKGFNLLIEAMADLKERHVHVQCDIAGEGPERETLEELLEERDVKDRVHFRGALPHPKAMERLCQSDALIVPSIITPEGDRDGLPNVILEAAAYGVPIIASDMPGIAEFVADSVSGLVFRSGDAINLAEKIEALSLDNGPITQTIQRNARRIVQEEYDIQKNIQPLVEVFQAAGS